MGASIAPANGLFDRLLGGIQNAVSILSYAISRLTLIVTIATACLSVYLYMLVPKGFFPQQDTGRIKRIGAGCAGHFLLGHEGER